MFFSVLVPVYNTSKYLNECVQSVLAQTENDYELVLLDDGSTDESSILCDQFAKQYSQIRVIHKANEGLMMTRRRGFKEAKGDYFICLDSDDYLCDNRALEKVKNLIIKEHCDLVIYNYIAGKERTEDDKLITLFEYPDGHVFTEENKTELYEKLLVGGNFNAIWIKAPSRYIVDIDVDYSVWKEAICRGEDLFQTFPMLTNAKRIGYVKDYLIRYRWTPGSISNNPKLKYYNAFKTIYKREDQYMKLWNTDADIIRKVNLARIPNILGIIINGYHVSKKAGKYDEWVAFMQSVSNDPFFAKMYSDCDRKEISHYYQLIGNCIMNGNIFMLTKILDAYQWYRRTIKHK